MELGVIKITIDLMEENSGKLPDFASTFILDLFDIEVVYWGMVMSRAPAPQNSTFRAYPAAFTHEPGVYIFGIKDDYTPQGLDPEIKIKIDVINRTWEVSDMSDGWKYAIESMKEDNKNAQIIFTFRLQ